MSSRVTKLVSKQWSASSLITGADMYETSRTYSKSELPDDPEELKQLIAATCKLTSDI